METEREVAECEAKEAEGVMLCCHICGCATFINGACCECGNRELLPSPCCAAKDARIASLTNELRQVQAVLVEKVERAGTLAADLYEARERIAELETAVRDAAGMYASAEAELMAVKRERDEAVKRDGALREALKLVHRRECRAPACFICDALKEGEATPPPGAPPP